MDFYTNIDNNLSLIIKNHAYNIVYTNTPHADGYNLKLEYKEFDSDSIIMFLWVPTI